MAEETSCGALLDAAGLRGCEVVPISSAPPERHSKAVLLAYGALALPLSIAEIPIIVYLPAFYAQQLGLGAEFVGGAFLIARLWDGISDLLAGWLSDRSRSRFGRRKPWAVLGAPFLVISTWYLCHPSRGAGLPYLAIWAVLFYSAFTAVKVPHLSWGTELATGYVERSRVTTFRETFTMLGYLFYVTAPLIALSAQPRLGDVLSLLSVTTLVTVPVAACVLAIGVPDRPQQSALEELGMKRWMALLKDRVLLRFLLARLCFATEEGVVNSLLVFSFGVGLGLPARMFWAIFILYVANLCTLPLTLRLAGRIEKHRLLALGVAIQALVYAVVLLVPAGSFLPIAFLWVAIGIANTAMLSLPTSILADIIDRGEAASGERRSGAYVAIDNLVYKIGMALGVGLAFGLMGLVHFHPAATHHDAADAWRIRLLGFGLPGLLSIPAAILYALHPITRDQQRRLRDQIAHGNTAPEIPAWKPV